MPTAHQLGMIAIDELTWPISYRFVTVGSQGWTQQDLHVDAPGLNNDHDHSLALGRLLWQGVVATATTANVQLAYAFMVAWHISPLAEPFAPIGARGLRLGRAAPRAHSPVLLLHSGHNDDDAARRVFLYGAPAEWQDGELLTDAGWDNLMPWAYGLAMGVLANFCGGEVQLLHAYPRRVDVVPENLGGVAFRRVSSLRVCQYVDKAPALSSELWP